jgi:hypothetical protein
MSQTSGLRIGLSLPSYDSLEIEDDHAYNHNPSNTLHPPSLSGLGTTNVGKSHANSSVHANVELLSVKGWPNEPQRLRERTMLMSFFNLCEALITLAPVAFHQYVDPEASGDVAYVPQYLLY